MAKRLRSGFTTGACAAAAARAAMLALISRRSITTITVRFPDASMVGFSIVDCRVDDVSATAFVVKDGGDDPDVTNGALIGARVRFKTVTDQSFELVSVKGGEGVGTVTKPGLAVDVGEPAINPVPMRMIKENVTLELAAFNHLSGAGVEVTILVPDGTKLAQKTLNERLGIIGGISILGTTGIVHPVSAEAWTGTIQSSLSVAEAIGIEEIILSTGRTSERSVERLLHPPREALVMMGDYLEFSLKEVRHHSFNRVHVATMWAKLVKGVLGYAQTHVRHGALDTKQVCRLLQDNELARPFMEQIAAANTAREILDMLLAHEEEGSIHYICRKASERYRKTAGLPVTIHLVHQNNVLMSVD